MLTFPRLLQGIVFVLSTFYKRKERTMRVSLFFGGAALAGAFGGILGYAISFVDGGGLPSWGWLFAIEGMFTVLVGISAYWWVPSGVRGAKVRSIPLSTFSNRLTLLLPSVPHRAPAHHPHRATQE